MLHVLSAAVGFHLVLAGAFVVEPAVDREVEIVVAADAIPAEKTAAKMIVTHLPKMLKTAVKVVTEGAVAVEGEGEGEGEGGGEGARRRIYVGWTKAAKAAGLAVEGFGIEEELVAVRNGALFVTGGRPRGARYAAADFLERLGMIYASDHAIWYPELKKLEWGEDLRRAPAFRARVTATPLFNLGSLAFNKSNMYRIAGAGNGGYAQYGRYGDCHTFVGYSRTFPADDPEVFAYIARTGKRAVPERSGMKAPLCPSSPKTLALMLDRLERDVKDNLARAATNGLPRPIYYEVSMDDELTPCECPECSRIAEEEGGYAGVMLHLVNPMARRLAELDPAAKLTMLVYQKTLIAPRHIRPEPNVQPRVCVHDNEWAVNVLAEAGEAVTAPHNAAFLANMDRWRSTTTSFGIWEYWEYYRKGFFPYFAPRAWTANFSYYAGNRGENMLVEIEKPFESGFVFKHYLALKVLDDPFVPYEKRRDDFCKAYYGDAAKVMAEYFDFLSDAFEGEAAKAAVGPRSPKEFGYLNEDFYRKAFALLGRAETAVQEAHATSGCAPEASLARVRAECIPLHRSLFRREFRPLLAKLGFDRRRLAAEMHRNEHAYLEDTFGKDSPAAKRYFADSDNFTEGAALEVPLPPEVKGVNIFDYKFNQLPAYNAQHTRIVPCEGAVGGKALELFAKDGKVLHDRKEIDFYTLPFTAGVYNPKLEGKAKSGPNLELKSVPQDERFHLYRIGKGPLCGNARIWAHWLWSFWMRPEDACMMTPDYEAEFWISLKFTGPAFVKGSKRPNGIFIDRIIIAE